MNPQTNEVTQLRVLFFSPSEDETLGAWFDRWITNTDSNEFLREVNRIRQQYFVDHLVTNETRTIPAN